MGNCCSSSTPNDTSKGPPQRQGAEGLLDLGLEFRCLPCPEHEKNDTSNSKPTLRCPDCSHRMNLLQKDEKYILITNDNRKRHVPGRVYDPAAKAAQEEVITWLQRDFNMHHLPLFDCKPEDTIDSDATSVNALVTKREEPPSDKPPQQNSTNGTLVIINGRGVARAGILSTRHTFELGAEKGSASHHIQQAIERNLAVVCLDSNAQGSARGLETVCQSLDSPALVPYLSQNNNLYFLCHSAAGGNLVQYMLRETTSFSINQIKALVFTDSTHDLQWLSLQANPTITAFVQSPTCLYIRNNRERAGDTFGPNHKDRNTGDPYDQSRDAYWKKRFGDIQTVYAGTIDHSLMCYRARKVIWDFVDSRLLPDK